MKKTSADSGYRGKLAENVEAKFGYEKTLCSDKVTDFKPLLKRWAVERTFSWFENYRRLAKDYEYNLYIEQSFDHIGFHCDDD